MMIIVLSIKFIYMLRIHMKQNINMLLKIVKIMVLKSSIQPHKKNGQNS